MPQVLPDTNSLLNDLNQLRKDGALLTNSVEIARLERAIEAVKTPEFGQPVHHEAVAAHLVVLAMLRCMTGYFDQVLTLGDRAMQLTTNHQLIWNQIVSLTVAGYFSRARALFDSRLLDDDLLSFKSSEQSALSLIMDCQSYERGAGIMEHFVDTFPREARAISEAKEIFDRLHIDEQQVLDMLDIAGQMMREKHVFLAQNLRLHTYPTDRFMTISLPVALPADEVAKMEWEYLGKVVERFPEFSFSSFSIGFSCPHEVCQTQPQIS